MLNEILILFTFGFGAGIMSLLISALGIWRMRPIALILAGLWTIPATYYLSGLSGFPLYLISLLQFGGAYAVSKRKPRMAWYLLIPLALVTVSMTLFTLYNIFESPR